MNSRILALAALGTAITCASSLPATAADRHEETAVAVTYSDLDLSTTEGAKELDHRLQQAAQRVCGMDEHITGSHLPSEDARACYKQALQQLQARFAAAVAKQKQQG